MYCAHGPTWTKIVSLPFRVYQHTICMAVKSLHRESQPYRHGTGFDKVVRYSIKNGVLIHKSAMMTNSFNTVLTIMRIFRAECGTTQDICEGTEDQRGYRTGLWEYRRWKHRVSWIQSPERYPAPHVRREDEQRYARVTIARKRQGIDEIGYSSVLFEYFRQGRAYLVRENVA